MALTKIPAITREFFRVPITLTVGGVAINPTALTVEWAVIAVGATPADGDWKTGSWETLRGGTPSASYLARVLVGDSTTDVPLTKDQMYDAWLRITDTPERPTRLIGQIQGV